MEETLFLLECFCGVGNVKISVSLKRLGERGNGYRVSVTHARQPVCGLNMGQHLR
jgi:hypothetical protein